MPWIDARAISVIGDKNRLAKRRPRVADDKCSRRSESPSGSRIALTCTAASGIFRRGDPHLRAPRRKTPTATESSAAADVFGNRRIRCPTAITIIAQRERYPTNYPRKNPCSVEGRTLYHATGTGEAHRHQRGWHQVSPGKIESVGAHPAHRTNQGRLLGGVAMNSMGRRRFKFLAGSPD